MSKNNVIQLHAQCIANFMQSFKIYAIYGNTDENFLYKRKPLDHVFLKLIIIFK